MKNAISALNVHVSPKFPRVISCLLYTSDAADEEDSVDLGGRRIIKKKFVPLDTILAHFAYFHQVTILDS